MMEPEADPGRLRSPAVACPRCGTRPAFRVSELAIEGVRGAPGASRVGTYKCHRRGCGAIYEITAAAYQEAF